MIWASKIDEALAVWRTFYIDITPTPSTSSRREPSPSHRLPNMLARSPQSGRGRARRELVTLRSYERDDA